MRRPNVKIFIREGSGVRGKEEKGKEREGRRWEVLPALHIPPDIGVLE